MWRSFFLAIGVYGILLGAEAMAIQRAELRPDAPLVRSDVIGTRRGGVREVVPPPWAPWSLLSAGTVVVLYSFTIPRRLNG